MIGALLIAGLLEGIGVMALLPLVSIMTEQESSNEGVVFQIIHTLFNTLGLTVTIGPILIFITGLIILKSIITMFAMAQVAHASAHVCTDLRLQYLQNLFAAKWKHFCDLQSGASANAIGIEAQRSAYCFMHSCYALSWMLQVIVYGVIAFLISWKLTIAAGFAGVLMVISLTYLIGTGRKAGNEQTKVLEQVLARITDTLFGVKPLKAMGKEQNLLSMIKGDVLALRSAQLRMDVSRHALRVLSEPVMVTFMAIGIFFILKYGNLPISELLFLALLFLRMVMKISAVQSAYLAMVTNESALWSLIDKIKEAKSMGSTRVGTKEPSLNDGILIKNVTFSHGTNLIFENLNLKLPSKGLHVLCGPSGEGKTTLIDLIIGLNFPDNGSVLIDGVDLTDINIKAWRERTGYVPQDVLLFHDTIANNIRLNDHNISDDEIIDVLKAVDAYDFVQKMDHGIDTIVGERGNKISGGQRQRIAIARAIINQPSLLILDEATSALDKQTEKDIVKTLKQLSEYILIVAISHNVASLEQADTITKIENGILEPIKQ
ncbi:MAG: ABC transporter ATP-binding protein [Alphaproteobacteria bacterium]